MEVRDEGIILEKTTHEFENQAVLNPGCVLVDGIVHMFYRAVREGNFSTIGYCQLKDNKVVYRADAPVLSPEHDYESHGLEDPRIVKFDDTYYLFYTAYDGKNASVAYATTKDLTTLTKCGVITPRILYRKALEFFDDIPMKEKYIQAFNDVKELEGNDDMFFWEKDTFLFPQKINGQYALVHRVMPGIQVIYFNSFDELRDNDYWLAYLKNFESNIILNPRAEDRWIGGGCPPIPTEAGWLFIYHRVRMINGKRQYCAAAALLDRDNPTKVLGKLIEPLFVPIQRYELKGDVNNVVFPTGAIEKEGRIHIYYGAADSLIACRSVDKKALLDKLLEIPV